MMAMRCSTFVFLWLSSAHGFWTSPSAKRTQLWSVYRDLGDAIWQRLDDLEILDIGDLGSKVNTNTTWSVRAGSSSKTIRYARAAHLESNNGLDVLNVVIVPTARGLPVWGADFVQLPGKRNLLLLDAQPMSDQVDYSAHWSDWFLGEGLPPSAGPLPEAVQRFVSPTALWTRLQDMEHAEEWIESKLPELTLSHLDLYLDLLAQGHEETDSWLADYWAYRRDNDPAKPLLTKLLGADYTKRLLDEVLFPKSIS